MFDDDDDDFPEPQGADTPRGCRQLWLRSPELENISEQSA